MGRERLQQQAEGVQIIRLIGPRAACPEFNEIPEQIT